ncbi:hypothetical protein N7468_006254 [Penicillium chermesinum]|uniref:mitogen-activated protein kinase n=1 Tax=Penicillium chermesinum TaxID=63820 RepID=A0A9W9NS10_9EURO|nr:uncharacterized protein N7468_006254 [Penicillium chermesinum]KAJ5225029.1 hypothetical protein N7468_006254 [Penicillium chermesinum]
MKLEATTKEECEETVNEEEDLTEDEFIRKWVQEGTHLASGSHGAVILHADGKRILKVPKAMSDPERYSENRASAHIMYMKHEVEMYKFIEGLPGVLPVLNSEKRTKCIEMPYMRQGTIAAYLKRVGKATKKQVSQWIVAIGETLIRLHEKGVAFNDLHTGNILLDDDLVPYICDLGLAEFLGSEESPGDVERTEVADLVEITYKLVTGAHERMEIYEDESLESIFLGPVLLEAIDGYHATMESFIAAVKVWLEENPDAQNA